MPAPIYLPAPTQREGMSLAEAIAKRRSIRDFTSRAISQSQLSQILWAAQGITDASWRLRSAPSAGATYPLVVFVACGKDGVDDVDEGIYRYDSANHSLSQHYNRDVRLELARASLGQQFIYQAPLDIVICALYSRTQARYGTRGERYIFIEVGHAGQNIYLQATALGLGTVAVGAFGDELVREVLRLDKEYKPLYIMPVGNPAY